MCPMTGNQDEARLDLAKWTSVEAVAIDGVSREWSAATPSLSGGAKVS